MKHTVTIMNDTSLMDGQGLVHTWLAYQEEGESPQYFSFASDGELKPYGFPGIVSISNEFGNRPTSRTYPIEITQEQFNKLTNAIHDFTVNPPIYDFTPKKAYMKDRRAWHARKWAMLQRCCVCHRMQALYPCQQPVQEGDHHD